MILLHKTGKPTGGPSSYRSVYLLNIRRKILERVIYNKLLPAVATQGGLLGRQYGVRNARSTTDAMKFSTGLVEDTIREKVNTDKTETQRVEEEDG